MTTDTNNSTEVVDVDRRCGANAATADGRLKEGANERTPEDGEEKR